MLEVFLTLSSVSAGLSVYCLGNGIVDHNPMCSTTLDWEYQRWSLTDVLFTRLFISSQDVEQLASKLPNLLQQYLVPLSDFNHLDYLWAIDADTLVYKPIIEKMNSL